MNHFLRHDSDAIYSIFQDNVGYRYSYGIRVILYEHKFDDYGDVSREIILNSTELSGAKDSPLVRGEFRPISQLNSPPYRITLK